MRFTLITLLLFSSLSVQAKLLKINISGIRKAEGHLALSIFPASAAKDFPSKSEKAVFKKYLPLDGKTELVIEAELEDEGPFAVSLLHDQNSDGDYNSFMGVPREGFGFSNNPGVYFGPPDFDEAQIKLVEEASEIEIKLKYFL